MEDYDFDRDKFIEQVKKDYDERMAKIDIMPLPQLLDILDEFFRNLPDEHYPPAIHYQIIRQKQMVENETQNP